MSTRGGISPRRRSTSPPPASLPDDDDMLREILLRLPPLPSSLPRASLVSKRWCSLVVDPQFQRCFRDHHGKPPLLGFFIEDFSRSYAYLFVPILDRPDRIPRRRLSMSLHEGDRIVDCRHGLVLSLSRRPPHRLLVWDPVSREQRRLIVPPELDNDQMFTGAVLRPAGSQGSHFQVALIASDTENTRVFACFYSSQTGIWSKINSLQLQTSKGVSMIGSGPSTLIGNSLCWSLWVPPDHHLVLEFDLDRQSLTVSELPPQVRIHPYYLRILRTEDGGLGFIHISMGTFHGQLWKREPGSVWVLDRAIEFDELRSACKGDLPSIVGSSEDSNAILVHTGSGVFMVYLRSMEFKKISNMGDIRFHYPFACFYPAGMAKFIGVGYSISCFLVLWPVMVHSV